MLPKINPSTTNAWNNLSAHAEEMKKVHLRDLFKNDPDRFSNYSRQFGDILFDYSKNIITDETLLLLHLC